MFNGFQTMLLASRCPARGCQCSRQEQYAYESEPRQQCVDPTRRCRFLHCTVVPSSLAVSNTIREYVIDEALDENVLASSQHKQWQTILDGQSIKYFVLATVHVHLYSGTSPYGHLTSKKTSQLQSPWLSPKLYSTVQITPCNKVTSPLRSILPSPVGDLNSEVPLY